MKKIGLFLLLLITIISCSNSSTSPSFIDVDGTFVGGNLEGIYLDVLTPPGTIINDRVYDLPAITPTPPYVRMYPKDPGPDYGELIIVNTPHISADGREDTRWYTRINDTNRLNYLWGRILANFELDRGGLAIVFGKKFESSQGGEPKHPDLKYAKPNTLRMYQTINHDGSFDFRQPFFKHARDFGTYLPSSTSVIKKFRGAVIVGIDKDPLNLGGVWVSNYVIGGVYYNVGRLAYGNGQGYHNVSGRPVYPYLYKGENNFYTGGSTDEEIYIIRSDVPMGEYNGKKYWKVDLLFLAVGQYDRRGIVINKNKIHKYSDPAFRSCNLNNPYLFAMKHSDAESLKRK